MAFEHARHNSDLCDIISTNGEYSDWVVTTAFYSCLHYVQSKMFPLDGHVSFSKYYLAVIRKKRKGVSKHKATINLVYKQLPAIGARYEKLHDLCMTARYQNYRISDALANEARLILSEVKNVCEAIPIEATA